MSNSQIHWAENRQRKKIKCFILLQRVKQIKYIKAKMMSRAPSMVPLAWNLIQIWLLVIFYQTAKRLVMSLMKQMEGRSVMLFFGTDESEYSFWLQSHCSYPVVGLPPDLSLDVSDCRCIGLWEWVYLCNISCIDLVNIKKKLWRD